MLHFLTGTLFWPKLSEFYFEIEKIVLNLKTYVNPKNKKVFENRYHSCSAIYGTI